MQSILTVINIILEILINEYMIGVGASSGLTSNLFHQLHECDR